MYQFFVEPQQININDKSVIITGQDVKHIRNVLRMRAGEEISVSNGQDGKEYRCAIAELSDTAVRCELRFVKEDSVELPVKVTLFQGLPKGDKMEFIIQKSVELGVHRIVPVAAKRCVVKLDEKKARAKIERWQGIAEAAAKQSKRGIIPRIEDVKSFDEAIDMAEEMDVKLLPYELADGMARTRELVESICPGQSVAVFIGPEGGFDVSEAEYAAERMVERITLGKRILRTETAGMVVLAWLGYFMEQ